MFNSPEEIVANKVLCYLDNILKIKPAKSGRFVIFADKRESKESGNFSAGLRTSLDLCSNPIFEYFAGESCRLILTNRRRTVLYEWNRAAKCFVQKVSNLLRFTSIVAAPVIVSAGWVIVDLQDLVGHIQEQTLSDIHLDFRPGVLVIKLVRQVEKHEERHFRDKVDKKYIVLTASNCNLKTTTIGYEPNLTRVEISKLISRAILQLSPSLVMYFVTLNQICQSVSHLEEDIFLI